jgi:hypothetical protein
LSYRTPEKGYERDDRDDPFEWSEPPSDIVLHEEQWIFKAERYPEYYSAYWPTRILPSGFVRTAKVLGAEKHHDTIIYRNSMKVNEHRTFGEVQDFHLEPNDMDNDYLFLRITLPNFDIGWQLDDVTGRNLAGFSSDSKSLRALRRFYAMTSEFPYPERDVERILKNYAEREESRELS